ncbi:MAG: hypothetical protein IJ719_23285 [Clostridia bacterium]|nr:hypothetical protein [Clostridia bacterium]
MRLLLQEIKKIWNPVIVIIIMAFGLIYYVLFSGFYIQYYVNGSDDQAVFDLTAEWSQKYGNTLEYNEYEEIAQQLEDEKLQFADQLKDIPLAVENSITTYEEFRAFENDYYDRTSDGKVEPDTERTKWTIINNSNFFRIQGIEQTIQYYKLKSEGDLSDFFNGDHTDAEAERLIELNQSAVKFGYIPPGILDSTTGLTISFMIWVIISVIILLSPTIVRDRLNRMQNLQFSSFIGRSILLAQIKASLVSAAILTVLNCLIYGVLLISKGALVLKDFYLYSYSYVPWFDWTYGTYLLVLASMALIIGVMTGGFTVFLSRYSRNYIGMLIKSVLLLGVLIFTFSMLPIVTRPFFMFNPMSLRIRVKGIEFILLGALALCSVLVIGIALVRQRHKELS